MKLKAHNGIYNLCIHTHMYSMCSIYSDSHESSGSLSPSLCLVLPANLRKAVAVWSLSRMLG